MRMDHQVLPDGKYQPNFSVTKPKGGICQEEMVMDIENRNPTVSKNQKNLPPLQNQKPSFIELKRSFIEKISAP